jgi:hypothetical protein
MLHPCGTIPDAERRSGAVLLRGVELDTFSIERGSSPLDLRGSARHDDEPLSIGESLAFARMSMSTFHAREARCEQSR